MKVKKIVPKILILVLLYIIVRGGIIIFVKFPILEDKDAEIYATMVDSFKALKVNGGLEKYEYLDTHSKRELFMIRYRAEKKRFLEDEEYRTEHIKNETQSRKDRQERRRKVYQSRLTGLEKSDQTATNADLKEKWQQSSSWDKGLVLREKCIEFLELQRRESGGKELRVPLDPDLSKVAPIGKIPVSESCMKWVPVGHEERVVEQALANLKQNMNYYYFSQLVEQAGIKSLDEVISFPEKIRGMTKGLTDG